MSDDLRDDLARTIRNTPISPALWADAAYAIADRIITNFTITRHRHENDNPIECVYKDTLGMVLDMKHNVVVSRAELAAIIDYYEGQAAMSDEGGDALCARLRAVLDG